MARGDRAPLRNQVNVRLDDETFRLLDTVARVEGVDRADLVREGVALLLEVRTSDPQWRQRVLDPHLSALRQLGVGDV